MNRDEEHIKRLGNKLLNKIISVTSFGNSGRGNLGFRPLASWFYKHFDISEEEFVLALAYLRKTHPDFYYKIDIPRKWDGGAHLEFPELFFDGNMISLKAIRSIPMMLIDEDKDLGPYEKEETFVVSSKIAAMLIKRRMAEKINVEN